MDAGSCRRVDWHAEDHEQTMLALGLSSKREITRTRIRVRTAMATQTREQGRYLGGLPPYGYRLGDAGPHPNKAHAAWGRRAHRLEPDPETAHVVRWMFAQRLAGHSAARITRALNDAGVPCPSASDPGRNSHRTGAAWTLRTVAAILANPRYTGRQVWNRQRTDFDLLDPVNTSLGHRPVTDDRALSGDRSGDVHPLAPAQGPDQGSRPLAGHRAAECRSGWRCGVNQLPAQSSQALAAAAVDAGDVVSPGVLRQTAAAAGRGMAGDVASCFASGARPWPDMIAIQKRAGRPR